MVQACKDLPEIVFEDFEIYYHTAFIYLFTAKKGFNGEIVPVELLALPVILFKPMSGRE
jgi:hypothetical protein